MKTSLITLSILALGLISCEERSTQIHDLLENDNTRKEIFNKIASNHEYMEGMNTAMVENGSAIQIFEANPGMVNHLINNDGMVKLLKNNPEAKEHLMSMMLKDTAFNSQLIYKAIQDEKNSSKMVKQLEANKILSKVCIAEANEEIAKKFTPAKPKTK